MKGILDWLNKFGRATQTCLVSLVKHLPTDPRSPSLWHVFCWIVALVTGISFGLSALEAPSDQNTNLWSSLRVHLPFAASIAMLTIGLASIIRKAVSDLDRIGVMLLSVGAILGTSHISDVFTAKIRQQAEVFDERYPEIVAAFKDMAPKGFEKALSLLLTFNSLKTPDAQITFVRQQDASDPATQDFFRVAAADQLDPSVANQIALSINSPRGSDHGSGSSSDASLQAIISSNEAKSQDELVKSNAINESLLGNANETLAKTNVSEQDRSAAEATLESVLEGSTEIINDIASRPPTSDGLDAITDASRNVAVAQGGTLRPPEIPSTVQEQLASNGDTLIDGTATVAALSRGAIQGVASENASQTVDLNEAVEIAVQPVEEALEQIAVSADNMTPRIEPEPEAREIAERELLETPNSHVTPAAKPANASEPPEAVPLDADEPKTPHASPSAPPISSTAPPKSPELPRSVVAEALAQIRLIGASHRRNPASPIPYLDAKDLRQRLKFGDLHSLAAKDKSIVDAALSKLESDLRKNAALTAASDRKNLRVTLYYPSDSQRTNVRLVQLWLNKSEELPQFCPGIQNVGRTGYIPSKTQVRYFKKSFWGFLSKEDAKDHAKRLAYVLGKQFPAIGPIEIVYVEPSRDDELHSNFEIWFSRDAFPSEP